jgi:hypothetical protein
MQDRGEILIQSLAAVAARFAVSLLRQENGIPRSPKVMLEAATSWQKF